MIGGEKHVGHEQEADQVSQLRGVRREPCPRPADQQQHGDEELVVQVEQRQKQSVRAEHRVVVARVVGRQLAKQAPVLVLSHEALGDPHAQHRFGQRRGDAAERIGIARKDSLSLR